MMLEFSQQFLVFFGKDRFITYNLEEKTLNETVLPKPLSKEKFHISPSKSEVSATITCGSVSKENSLIAVSDRDKRLLIWSNNKLIQEYFLQRVAIKLVFTKSEESILVADKSGDVYFFSLKDQNTKNGTLLMGHCSMLLDISLNEDTGFLITTDRDEKIRVSHYPKAYNIHIFCLGHTDFVNNVTLLNKNLLLSSSGDSTLRLWDIDSGKELAVHHFQNMNTDRQLVPRKLVLNTLNNLLAICFYQEPFLRIFTVEKQSIQQCQEIVLKSVIIDMNFDFRRNQLWIITVTEGISTYEWTFNEITCTTNMCRDVVDKINLLFSQYFADKASENIDHLRKQFYDNVKSYYEKKREREEIQKLKKARQTLPDVSAN